MLGTTTRTRKQNPIIGIVLPLLLILLMAAACFGFCWLIWWLNMNTATTAPSF
ncbi:MAG: hypothetical protein M3328_11290 [Chloroflexota bacterium]|nr:hypothetical protein [Chloroflexota bacterium]